MHIISMVFSPVFIYPLFLLYPGAMHACCVPCRLRAISCIGLYSVSMHSIIRKKQ